MREPVIAAGSPVTLSGGQATTLTEWIDHFAFVWADPARRLEALLDLLSPDVRLVAPGFAPTRGHDAARRAFERTLHALPDLTAVVDSWGVGARIADRGDGPVREIAGTATFTGTVYVQMTFSASIGRRRLTWPNVDCFTFVDGAAVERVAHFDPTPIRAALLRSPSGLLRYLRLRMRIGRRRAPSTR